MKIEIKQIGKYDDRGNNSDYGAYTMLPMSSRKYVVQKGLDGLYRTGLEDKPEKKEYFEKIFKKDLSQSSDFWKSFPLFFRMPTGTMVLDLKDPEQELFYIVAVANYRLAPDKETLMEDRKFKANTIFYVDDKEKEARKKSELQELKDEVTKAVYDGRNDKERMLFIAHALNLFVTDSFKADNLYNLLTKYKENLKTKAQYELLRDVYKTPNAELQAHYYVKQGQKQSLIFYDVTVNKYRFQEKHIAKNEEELVRYFKDKKNEGDLAALIMEIKTR